MLLKGEELKKKSIALTLMRDVQGSAAQKLEMWQPVGDGDGRCKSDIRPLGNR